MTFNYVGKHQKIQIKKLNWLIAGCGGGRWME